jgi:Rieske Fe-S protein
LYALGAIVFGVILFLRVEDTSPQRFALLDLSEHPPGSATPYVPEAGRFPAFYLVRTEDDEVFAIVRLAPESGCLVEWNEDEGRFQDPCDGRLYDRRGVPVGGQGRALYHLAYERSEIDMVMIDLGRRVPNPHM